MEGSQFCFRPLEAIGLNLTYHCNLHCEMCAEQQAPDQYLDVANRKELDIARLSAVIDDIAQSQTFKQPPIIRLTGGEPLLKPGITTLITHLHGRGFRYALQTNGTLMTEALAQALVTRPAEYVHFSIDGPPEVHDRIRRKAGAYHETVAAIKLFCNVDTERRIPVFINCTISRSNPGNLRHLIDLARELDVGLRYQHLMFINQPHQQAQCELTRRLFNEPIPFKVLPFQFSAAEAALIADEVRAIRKHAPETKFLPNVHDDELERYYLDLDGYVHSNRCTYPMTTVRINPYGDVYPCMNYYYGNLTERSFAEIYYSDRRKRFLQALEQYGHFPGCIRCCKL